MLNLFHFSTHTPLVGGISPSVAAYLTNGGMLEKGVAIANHASKLRELSQDGTYRDVSPLVKPILEAELAGLFVSDKAS